MNTQEQRIEHMTGLMDQVSKALNEAQTAYRLGCQHIINVKPIVEELSAYYSSKQWKKDFEADEKGKLPQQLKRGVLSEDGLWNLLNEVKEWTELLQIQDK